MPAGNPFAYEPMRLGSSFLQGEAIARDREQMRQAMALRQAAEERARQENDYNQQIRPLDLTGRQLALRGQMLGTVETPEDYARVLPAVQAAGLPTADLPEGNQSTAWLQFRKPQEPAQSWLPERFRPADLSPVPQGERMAPALSEATMQAPGIAPEDIPAIQRAAERGLPLVQQTKMREAEANRGLRGLELDSRAEKYRTQLAYADRAAGLADKRFALQETKDERSARIESERIAMERDRLRLAREQAGREAGREIPKIAGYEPIPGQTVDAPSAKVARDAIAKLGSLDAIIGEFKTAYADAKKRGVAGHIIGPDADRLNGIRQRMLLNLKEAENLGVLQAVDIQTMEPIVPKAVGAGALMNAMVGRNDPMIALDQFEREVKGRLGSVVQSHGYQPIAKPAGKPSALPAGLVSRLKEGKQTTFGNGQVWTLQNGKPVQVK